MTAGARDARTILAATAAVTATAVAWWSWRTADRYARMSDADVDAEVAQAHTQVGFGEHDCLTLVLRVRTPKVPGMDWFWWCAVADRDKSTGLAMREVTVAEGWAATQRAANTAADAFHTSAHESFGHLSDDFEHDDGDDAEVPG